MSVLLEIEKLTKRFGGLRALNRIDLTIETGMIVGLIGPNGAGKTTLFNCLTGLYPADEGKIVFNDKSLSDLKSHAITALGLSRTFQNIRLFNNMTALENVLVGRHCRMTSGVWGAISRSKNTLKEEKEALLQANELIDFVGLHGKDDILAKNLAYGDQRKLEIARALASKPLLLLLDEPTAGMNPQETMELTKFIEHMRSELGLTILLIEHDMRVVMRISDRITVLDYGIKIAEGNPLEVRSNPQVVQAYLGRLGAMIAGQRTSGEGR
jgi:branched-chain amino acid transport system ATP-binding protein